MADRRSTAGLSAKTPLTRAVMARLGAVERASARFFAVDRRLSDGRSSMA